MLRYPLEEIQFALAEAGIDGWLLYEFHGRNPIAADVVRAVGHTTRRWFYFIPRQGEPQRICHLIEQAALTNAPGKLNIYHSWQSLHKTLSKVLARAKRIAMEYSPLAAVPYVSNVDAGTIELIRSLGVEVVSSGDLVSQFQARWTTQQLESHKTAAVAVAEIAELAFAKVRDSLSASQRITELDIHRFVHQQFDKRGMMTDAGPICGVGPNSGNPHHESSETVIERDAVFLLDLWCKMREPESVFADITKMAYTGSKAPDELVRRFAIICRARDRAVEFINEKMSDGDAVHGWEVDDQVRGVITKAGFGQQFIHRTGHSIGPDVHGTGPNIDNMETKDERRLIPGICFSIEPGIYGADFGVRTEIDVYIENKRAVVTTQPVQKEIAVLFR